MAEKSSELGFSSNADDNFIEKYSDEAENDSKNTEQLKAQIEETRSQMGETIDAIQEKLSISNITEQVKEQITEEISNVYETAKKSVYGATILKAGDFMKTMGKELSKTDVGKVVRNNPFPLFLIGLGVGLLAYQGFGGKKRRHNDNENYKGGGLNESALKSAQKRIGDVAGNAYQNVSSAANSAIGGITSATSSAYHTVGDKAGSAYETVSDAAGTAYKKVGDLGTQTREQYEYYIEENPLAVGAVALAVGAAVGFAIPSSNYEGELMGEYRQQVLDKAQTAAGSLVEKVKTVANEAVQTVQESVKEEVKAQGFNQ
ncbi:DUF3618 domain-containing protein [soil metagenome]